MAANNTFNLDRQFDLRSTLTMPTKSSERKLRTFVKGAYEKAFSAIGPRKWWPGDTAFEIILGAILTQNTAWKNVEKAIAKLKGHRVLSIAALRDLPENELAQMIRSSGYFNMKAKKIKAFIQFLDAHYDGSLKTMGKENLEKLREQLLQVHGIGPETADSILLYAFNKPSFVVDTYTRRIFSRHHIFSETESYDAMRDFFMKHADPSTFNEYHALIVHIGHHYCAKGKPNCGQCPWNWIAP